MGYSRVDVIELSLRGRTYNAPAGIYLDDEERIREAYWLIKPGEVVLDIGAGHGSYTLPALAHGARVYAIDSNADALNVLLGAALGNGFTDITTLCMAVYDGAPDIPLALRRQHKRSKHSPPRGAHWATLDGLVAGGVVEERVNWIKIDVEGAELGVLRGAIHLLERNHPRLVIEDHERVYEWTRRMQSANRIYDLLHDLGYRIEVVPYVVDGTPPRGYIIGTPCVT